jgi:hypothetical protein
MAAQLQAVQTLIGSSEKRIKTQHRSNEASKRLETIPGINTSGLFRVGDGPASETLSQIGSIPCALKTRIAVGLFRNVSKSRAASEAFEPTLIAPPKAV